MYEEANRLGCSVLSQFLFWYGDSDGVFVVVVIIVGCLVLLLSSSPLLTSCTHLPATQPDSSKVVCWLHCFVLLAFLSSFSNIPCWCCCCCFWSGLFPLPFSCYLRKDVRESRTCILIISVSEVGRNG